MEPFEARRNKSFKMWVNHVLASELFDTFIKPGIKTSWRQRFCGVKSSAKILVLESSELNTITAFKAQGVLESDMHIPNPSNSVCDAILAAHPDVSVTCETVGDFISTTTHTYDVVFLDYMCTVEGNKSSNPSQDIEQLFNRKLMTTPGLLATTFCKRNSKDINQEKIIRHVFQSALVNGYRITPVWSQVYQPSMVVTAYLVRELDEVQATVHEMEAFPQFARKRKAESCIDLVGNYIMWRGEKTTGGVHTPQWYPGKVVKHVGGDTFWVTWTDVNVYMRTTRTREQLRLQQCSDASESDARYGSWYFTHK